MNAPPPNAGFDYQIGGGYPLPAGVTVVSRDHEDTVATGAYNICYVNGFQAQTEAAGWWRANHPDLLLRKGGAEVVDRDWNELVLDISTPAKRAALADIVGGWITSCAAKGFKGVEVDNFDSFARSQGLLTADHAIAFAKLLAAHAHGKGLAIAQKNASELARAGKTQAGFDFAVAEECGEYDMAPGVSECQGYVDAYGANVIVIEYDPGSFAGTCAKYGSRLSVVLRDVNVSKPGSRSYVYQSC
ncbi:endo alpha-1,4 polygalactosaminidase [Dactylosporangium salmoneum]|uniref:Endo alpha-1,4 polygalactosaminidase n=1 Tax=Dactylosporangium salmoneum TaxID=53361 RepID=A0ABP5TT64_9ACTN